MMSQFYCVSCKDKRFQTPTMNKELKNGREAEGANCNVCKQEMWRIKSRYE